jgi:hypothetical protein
MRGPGTSIRASTKVRARLPFPLNAFGVVLALAYGLVWLRTSPTAALREQNVSHFTSWCFCYAYIRSIIDLGAQPEGWAEVLAPTTRTKARLC